VKNGKTYYKKKCKTCVKSNKHRLMTYNKPVEVFGIKQEEIKPLVKPVNKIPEISIKTQEKQVKQVEFFGIPKTISKHVKTSVTIPVKTPDKPPVNKIPSTMNEVLNMVNGKKYDNANNKNVELIMYSAIVGFKKLFSVKKKPVTQEKQKINHVSKNSFGSAMYYDNYNITLK
jgi:hypothetical protein